MKSSKTFDIVITGKTGSGKTALINGLIDRKVGEEGEALTRGRTQHVEPKELSINDDVVAKIWDTPGLQDGTDEEDWYLDEMKQYCSDCNLFIYCVNMSQRRLDAAEIAAMGKLTETFGKDFWKKVLFVLTFANSVEHFCPPEHDVREYFERGVKDWHDMLARKLVDFGVEQEIAEKIVVVPTGYSKPLKSNPDPWHLPGISNWFQNFWCKCAEVVDKLYVHDHITAAGIARSGVPVSSRKSTKTGAVMASTSNFPPDVAAGDALGNVDIDPTAISPIATGEL